MPILSYSMLALALMHFIFVACIILFDVGDRNMREYRISYLYRSAQTSALIGILSAILGF